MFREKQIEVVQASKKGWWGEGAIKSDRNAGFWEQATRVSWNQVKGWSNEGSGKDVDWELLLREESCLDSVKRRGLDNTLTQETGFGNWRWWYSLSILICNPILLSTMLYYVIYCIGIVIWRLIQGSVGMSQRWM